MWLTNQGQSTMIRKYLSGETGGSPVRARRRETRDRIVTDLPDRKPQTGTSH